MKSRFVVVDVEFNQESVAGSDLDEALARAADVGGYVIDTETGQRHDPAGEQS